MNPGQLEKWDTYSIDAVRSNEILRKLPIIDIVFYFDTDPSFCFYFFRCYEPLLESDYPRTWRDCVFCAEELHRPAGRVADQWLPRPGKLLSSPLRQYGQGKHFYKCILSVPVCWITFWLNVISAMLNWVFVCLQSAENIVRFCKDLKDSGLHSSPLQFTLQCALEAKKTSECNDDFKNKS